MAEADFLIVGAGFSGVTLANLIATKKNRKVMIIDKNRYIGGHSSDYYNRYGVLVHRHGPHYFRTISKDVFNYLSQFTTWNNTKFIVRAYVDRKYYPFPINRDTLNEFYSINLKNVSEAQLFIDKIKSKINFPRNFEEVILSKMGRDIYEKFFRNYTFKQWGVHPSTLAASVAQRIPIRTNTENSYINDKIQCIPKKGYTKLMENMLSHKNIIVKLNTPYSKVDRPHKFKYIIYTGSIDEFFNYKFGELPYRSLFFRHITYKQKFYQKWVQVNYPNDYKFTRIVEIKHVTLQNTPYTTIVKEYPRSRGKPFYPLLTKDGITKYKLYKHEAKKLKGKIFFIGRLAEYKYINMDQAVENAMNLFKDKISKLS